MNLPSKLERIRVSKQAKNSLLYLKRRTGIDQWNVLCRWAFCFSLAESKIPHNSVIVTDSNIEMGWRTFAGKYDTLFLALLKERCLVDGLPTDQQSLAEQFKLHLHRGISYLGTRGKIKNIKDLIQLISSTNIAK